MFRNNQFFSVVFRSNKFKFINDGQLETEGSGVVLSGTMCHVILLNDMLETPFSKGEWLLIIGMSTLIVGMCQVFKKI